MHFNAFSLPGDMWSLLCSCSFHKKQALEVKQPQPLCDHPGQKLSRQEHPKAVYPSTPPGWWARAPAVALLLLPPPPTSHPPPQEKPSRHKATCCLEQLATAKRQAANSCTLRENLEASLEAGGLCAFQAVVRGREVQPLKQSCLCLYDHVQPQSPVLRFTGTRSPQPSFQILPFPRVPERAVPSAIRSHDFTSIKGCFGWIPEELTGPPPALLAPLALESSLCRTMCSSMLFAFSVFT